MDNRSTVDVFYNGKLLQNIRRVEQGLTILSTCGKITTHWKVTLPDYGDLWYHPEVIANIHSLSQVSAKYRVQLEIQSEYEFHAQLKDGRLRRFVQVPQGLYYSDLNNYTGTVPINTVEATTYRFYPRDYYRALEAKNLQS